MIVRATFPKLSLDVSFPLPAPRAVYAQLTPNSELLYPSEELYPNLSLFPYLQVPPSRKVVI